MAFGVAGLALTDPIPVLMEYKNYDGVLSLSKFNKRQLEKYAEAADDLKGKAQYAIKNGQVSKPFKDHVVKLNKDLNAKYGLEGDKAKVWVELIDGNGMPIPMA